MKTGIDRPRAQWHEGKLYLRASWFGSCLRAVVLSVRGEHQCADCPFLMSKARDGQYLESDILARIGKRYPVTARQEQVEYRRGKIVVTGHVDGVADLGNNRRALAEAKTMSTTRFNTWMEAGPRAFPSYIWQTSVYAHSQGLQYVCMGILENLGLAEPGRFDMLVFQPLRSMEEIDARLDMIWDMAQEKAMPACTDKGGFWCPYRHKYCEE